MIPKHLLLAVPMVTLAAAGALAAPPAPSDTQGRGHAHESGALATNEERCVELMRQFDMASRNPGDQSRLGDAMALRKDGEGMCRYRNFTGGVAKLDQALAMLGQAPYGSAQ